MIPSPAEIADTARYRALQHQMRAGECKGTKKIRHVKHASLYEDVAKHAERDFGRKEEDGTWACVKKCMARRKPRLTRDATLSYPGNVSDDGPGRRNAVLQTSRLDDPHSQPKIDSRPAPAPHPPTTVNRTPAPAPPPPLPPPPPPKPRDRPHSPAPPSVLNQIRNREWKLKTPPSPGEEDDWDESSSPSELRTANPMMDGIRYALQKRREHQRPVP